MRVSKRGLTSLVSVLLIVSAALFTVGVAAERSSRSSESPAHSAAESATHGEGSGEAPSAEAAPDAAATSNGEHGERLLGIDPESWVLVAVGIAASVLLAAALLMSARRRPMLLLLAVVFGVVFAALDVRELAHQLNESRAGLAAIAVALVVLHGSVAVAASLALRQPSGPQPVVA